MTKDQLQLFRKLDRQSASLYKALETTAASKGDDALGKFKLGLVKDLLTDLDAFLGAELRPFENLAAPADGTTFGDAVIVLGQYRACLEEFEARNTKQHYGKLSWIVETDEGAGKGVEYVPVEGPADEP